MIQHDDKSFFSASAKSVQSADTSSVPIDPQISQITQIADGLLNYEDGYHICKSVCEKPDPNHARKEAAIFRLWFPLPYGRGSECPLDFSHTL